MKTRIILMLVPVLISMAVIARCEDTLRFGRFGQVFLYRAKPHPAHIVLFVSGDGGWNSGVVDMAKELTTLDALVVGIDIVQYSKHLEHASDKCLYPAADFEALSQFVQKQLNYPSYIIPVLVGYSSGATLVYATLVQAPSSTFRGGLSLGFCPDLMLAKPFCAGSGLAWKSEPNGKGYIFLPALSLEVPWIVLQGTIDQVCNAESTAQFLKRVKRGELVMLPKVGHGFSVPRNWMPQFKQAFLRLVAGPNGEPAPGVHALQDLPLVEVPAHGEAGSIMALHLTGDGGWGVTDKGLSQSLAEQGIPVVGLNSLKYFWTKRTPEEAANAVERILRYYLAAWKKTKLICIGYSFGAEVLPFIVTRLPAELRAKVRLLVLLGPGATAQFEFHLTNWLGGAAQEGDLAVLPEMEKLRGMPMLCFYGEEEKSICQRLDPGLAQVVARKGGHRLGSNYAPVAEEILREVR